MIEPSKQRSNTMSLEKTLIWHQTAVPFPTSETACVQIGCHYEEAGEMAYAMVDELACHELKEASDMYKRKHPDVVGFISGMSNEDKEELLDSLVDQIVTAAGVAHHLGFDLLGALDEVNRSNFSKFEDGKPVFDDNGKIAKGKDYSKPNLLPYIGV
jgi:predicted HAD superfamily Cof-like phosphohydrolase